MWAQALFYEISSHLEEVRDSLQRTLTINMLVCPPDPDLVRAWPPKNMDGPQGSEGTSLADLLLVRGCQYGKGPLCGMFPMMANIAAPNGPDLSQTVTTVHPLSQITTQQTGITDT